MVARQAPTVKPRKCEALEPKNLLSYVLVSTGSDFPSSHRAKETHRGPGLRHLRSIHRRLPYGVKVLLGCQLRVCCSLGLGGQTARCTQHQLHRPSRIVLVYSFRRGCSQARLPRAKQAALASRGKEASAGPLRVCSQPGELLRNSSKLRCEPRPEQDLSSRRRPHKPLIFLPCLRSQSRLCQRTWCDSIDQLLDQQLDVLIISAAQLQTLLSKDLPC